jgi:hypothetical protein
LQSIFSEQQTTFSPRIAPELSNSLAPEKKRAQGMPGEGLTHGPRAAKSTRQNHRWCRSSGIPCAAVLTLIRALLGAPGLLATVVRELIARELDTSVGVSEPHDFTSA